MPNVAKLDAMIICETPWPISPLFIVKIPKKAPAMPKAGGIKKRAIIPQEYPAIIRPITLFPSIASPFWDNVNLSGLSADVKAISSEYFFSVDFK